ncbi:hypothetical protein [Streptomyces acidicola]|uniref:hypothetical protein n=1 Tax=Streptomyces acidicola TaxID=2596892 RepID=UPI00380B529B
MITAAMGALVPEALAAADQMEQAGMPADVARVTSQEQVDSWILERAFPADGTVTTEQDAASLPTVTVPLIPLTIPRTVIRRTTRAVKRRWDPSGSIVHMRGVSPARPGVC